MSSENDLIEIKNKIYNENQISKLLLKLGCKNIVDRSNRFEAQLPDKFNSDNPRSVQVYNTEYLQCRIRSRSISNIDIYGLVSYIEFNSYTEESRKRKLYEAKQWICDVLGYELKHYKGKVAFDLKNPVKIDHLSWLKSVKNSRKKSSIKEYSENKIYEDSVLDQYVMKPYREYVSEGIDKETQVDFQIGVDVLSERIIFPVHNQYGDIVSIKGRTIHKDYDKKGIYKFMYLYNFNKVIELYNFHKALTHILIRKEVIIFEGEKSCWLATQYGYANCVAISGDDLSAQQVKLIKDLGSGIRVIIAMDKDKGIEDVKKQGDKFGMNRSVFALWDSEDLLSEEEKDSPVDKGREIFEQLYDSYENFRIN
ncbi:toprim domain-containing protein [Paenibacillaceae bacterium]|nr:toprim domain-containing protein [Paenibacillaceae bacterium]